jgi:Flp pilus assembly protein TadG
VKLRSRSQGGQRGSAIVEFVVILPALLLVMFGTIELSRLWLTIGVAAEAAREAARMGAVSSPFSDTAAIARVNDLLASVGATASTAPTVTCSGSCATGDTVTSSVGVNFQISIPLLVPVFGSSIPLSQTAQMRRE